MLIFEGNKSQTVLPDRVLYLSIHKARKYTFLILKKSKPFLHKQLMYKNREHDFHYFNI